MYTDEYMDGSSVQGLIRVEALIEIFHSKMSGYLGQNSGESTAVRDITSCRKMSI